MNNGKTLISRSDIRFWILVGAIVVSIVGWGVRLDTKVNAINDTMWDKGAQLRKDYESDITEMKGDIKEIKRNQQKIMIFLGVDL